MAYLGEIRMFAGAFAPSGWAVCDGSVLQISDNPQLANYIGKVYGGDGFTTFALPNLGANQALHVSDVYPLGKTGSGPLGVSAPPAFLYLIATQTPPQSLDVTPFVGEIRTFAFGAIPRNWALCDGTILNITDNAELFSLLENRYGGDSGAGTFALPDLSGNTVAPVESSDPLGYTVMSYCIATAGTFPSQS